MMVTKILIVKLVAIWSKEK